MQKYNLKFAFCVLGCSQARAVCREYQSVLARPIIMGL